MAIKTYTPSIAEVLKKVNNAKTKDKKIAILKENDNESLRMIIKSSFDPKIKWAMPQGQVPYKPNEVPEGTEHTLLMQEAKRLWHFIEGADNRTPRMRKENRETKVIPDREVKLPDGFAVSVAYNKSGYQLIPKDDL